MSDMVVIVKSNVHTGARRAFVVFMRAASARPDPLFSM